MFEGTVIKKFEGATCARLRAEGGSFLRDHSYFGAGLDRAARRDAAEQPPMCRFGDLSTRPPYLAIKLRKSGDHDV